MILNRKKYAFLSNLIIIFKNDIYVHNKKIFN